MAIRPLKPLRIVASPIANPSDARASVEIYRPFFLAGILTVLTAGCTLGAIALIGIALRQNYTTAAWTPYILAHANSQLYGWVGFFVMGFALQQHPPSAGKLRLYHILARASLALMATGIGLRFVAEPMAQVDAGLWVPVGVISGILQLVSVALFMANTALTRYKTGEGLTWQTKFVFASLGWWLMVAAYEPWAFYNTHLADLSSSIAFTAQRVPSLRDAQFLGFVANMIFGVALVKMHSCFGAGEADRRWGNAAFAFWNLGVLVRSAGWSAYYASGMEPGAQGLYVFGGLLLGAGALCFVVASRMFGPLNTAIPAQKFVRAAFAWLLVAGVLIALEPLHLRLLGHPFSHAYIGAVRHALTVGFISQMIVGVGMHVVGRMNDLPARALGGFWLTFVLLNLGNAGRVALEIATDYTPAAYRPMGVTGLVELVGLAVWGWILAQTLRKAMVLGRPELATSGAGTR